MGVRTQPRQQGSCFGNDRGRGPQLRRGHGHDVLLKSRNAVARCACAAARQLPLDLLLSLRHENIEKS